MAFKKTPDDFSDFRFLGSLSGYPLQAFSDRGRRHRPASASVGRPRRPAAAPLPFERLSAAIRAASFYHPTATIIPPKSYIYEANTMSYEQPSFSVYDASAGSGKTYTLVKEYLRIILTADRPDAYRNILAITFTNKAVHEMKSRIVDSLVGFASDTPSEKTVRLMEVLADETGRSLPQLKAKANAILRHLIHNYAAFDISTIDKFTHRVIRTFAHDLELPLSFEVSLDTENLLAEAVDAVIAQAGENPELTELLLSYTLEKTDDDKSWDVSRDILDTGKLLLRETNRHEIALLSETSIGQFRTIRDRLRDTLTAIEAESRELAGQALALITQHGIDPSSFYSSYVPKHFLRVQQGAIEIKEGHYKYLEAAEGKRYPAKAPASDKAAIDGIADTLLEMLVTLNALAAKHLFYTALTRNITPLSLLNTVAQQLAVIRDEQNLLPISEFNAIIHNEIKNQPAPFIYERIGERYRHFFIDEFQDTSEMQWGNLVPLIDNALSGTDDYGQKGTLLIVGDPKQSIYRWRGGKAEQFIELSKGKHPFKNPDWKLFSLETNRRSATEVIHFNNDFFRYLSGTFEHPDYADLYENRAAQKTNDKVGGYVRLSFLPTIATDDEDETADIRFAKATAATIEEVRGRGFSYADIAVLTRKTGQGIAVARYLTSLGIPIVSSETLLIANAPEVQLLLAAFRYLNHPGDAESKALFLFHIGSKAGKAPLHDFIAAGLDCRDETALEQWLEREGLPFRFSHARTKGMYEMAGLLASVFLTGSHNAYTQYFLDLVLEREQRGQGGLADFLDYWEKKGQTFSIPSPEGRDAVRILTIHKSKGLEFPVVIMPFAEEDFAKKPREKLWLDAEDPELGLPKVLVDSSSAVLQFGPAAREVYTARKQEELLDNVNVLYVALTRAEEQLYVISSLNLSPKGEPKPNTLSGFFLGYLQQKGLFESNRTDYVFGNPTRLSTTPAPLRQANPIRRVARPLDFQAIRIARREALMWGTRQQEAIAYGTMLHEILASVRTADDIQWAVQDAVSSGWLAPDQLETVTRDIEGIVAHPDLQAFFSAESVVLNERSLVGPAGIARPDRIVLSGKSARLLDYKTGARSNSHLTQIEHYASLLQGMGYDVVKKALVYTGAETEVVLL
ncbi:UvrD-helicase domain-containing protein [Flavobacterium sp. N1718]|uniref:UvrD-helicase domain-containing protein n=1 Tax=unclassified Flavobacterium TaxID=196869 RepID=UPI0029CAC450|nr:UvrD-helicase domain-containing protein [Flavobacterium sp. N1718]